MPEIVVSSDEIKDGKLGILRAAVLAGFATSNGEARRLIQNRGLRLNGVTVQDEKSTLDLEASVVLQKGKNEFRRLKRS
jgi:tyrosyl-tRNA synthetase